MADFTVKLTIAADGTVAVRALRDVQGAMASMSSQATAAGGSTARAFDVAAKGTANLGAEIKSVRNSAALLYGAFAALGGAVGVARSLVAAADAAGQLRARLQFATHSAEEYAAVQARIEQVARSSYKSIEDVSEVFIRAAEPMRQLGMSSKQTLDLTEALSLGLVVSGANAQASASAIDAFGRAMQTGALRGQEFQTVIQRAPAFAQALEQALGKTRAELIGMAENGELTVAELAKVASQLGDLRGKAEQMPATLEDAMTRFHSAWLKFADGLNTSTGAMTGLVKGLDALGDNVGKVTVMVGALGAAHLAAQAPALLHDFAQRKVAASALAEAEAHMMKMRAMQATVPNVVALTAAEERLAAAQAAATAAGVGRAGMLARVGSGLLSLAGGPIGAAVLAISALGVGIYTLYQREQERIAKFNEGVRATNEAAQAIAELGDRVQNAGQQLSALPPLVDVFARWREESDRLAAAQAELAAKGEEIAGMEARIAAARTSSAEGAGVALLALVPKLEQLQGEYRTLEDAVNGLAAAMDRLDLNKYFDPTAAQVAGDQASQAFDQLSAAAKAAQAQIDKNKQGQIEYWQALANTRIEQEIAAGASAQRVAELRAENTAMLETIGSTLKKTTTTRELHAAARDAGAELVKSLQEQAATFGMSRDEIDRYKVNMADMSDSQRQAALDAIDLRAAQEEIARATNEEADALERLRGIAASEADRVQGMRDKLSGATAAQIAFNKAVRDAQAAYKAAGGASNAAAVKALADAMQKAKEGLSLEDQADEAERFANIMANLGDDIDVDPITKKMHEIEEAIKSMADPKHIDALQDALDKLNVKKAGATLERSASAVAQGLTSLQKLAGEGTEAYARMQVAIDAANIAAAIGAIVNQGMGDPYTAFARIAAMAALVSQFVGDVGAASAAGFDSGRAERQQAQQGTGTVLGDASAKSESIAHAVEITANATEQLVGINRGMLRALQSLQQALGSAGVSLARGAANADFPALQDNVGALFGTNDKFDHAVNSFLFGGSQEVIDQGIIIAGGVLQDMIDQMAIGAYQTVEEDGGLFGSDSTWDAMSGVSEAFGRQFQLVIGSIVDAVREGATALGMLPADIEAAIAQYRVEEIRISLKGLSAEDQQKELEAVFSSIFDGLAGAVVPFIEQFQQVGEGLGETLVRVATEVQITQEAFKQLGMVVNETDPERFAQIADGLVTAAGGIDDFISGLQQFVSSFASDAQQFRVAQDALTSAFEQYGLALPATRDGMYALMQSLDATTEAGREQIATLLRLAQTADSYYSLLDKAQSDAIKQIEDAITTLSEFGVGVGEGGNKLRAISQSAVDAIKAANLLAQAAGKQGAAEWQLALIHRVAATRAAEAIAQLMSATAEMVSNFYSGNYAGDAESASSAVRGFGDAMSSAAQQASDAIRLLLGELSPLNDQAKLQVALQALQRGEVGREDVLQIGRRLYASSQAYTDLFNRVMAMAVPTTGGSDSMTVGSDSAAGASKSPEQIARERMDLAMQIAQNVATLSNAQGETFDDIAGMLHLNLADIAGAMGLTNDDLTSYLENLVDQENRTPDSVKEGADRIIAAMYDIASGGTGPDAVFEDRSHLYDVPEPKTLQISGPTPEAAQNTEALNRVGDMLGELLVAVRTGNGEIAQAVDGVADATRDVRRSVDNGNDAAQAGLGRNLRVIV